MSRDDAVLPGTLDLLILGTLHLAPMHGWGITDLIRRRSGEVFRVNQGSLYVALDRLQSRGWIVSDWPHRQLALAFDPTTLDTRFVSLTISVLYRGTALPIAWRIVPSIASFSTASH